MDLTKIKENWKILAGLVLLVWSGISTFTSISYKREYESQVKQMETEQIKTAEEVTKKEEIGRELSQLKSERTELRKQLDQTSETLSTPVLLANGKTAYIKTTKKVSRESEERLSFLETVNKELETRLTTEKLSREEDRNKSLSLESKVKELESRSPSGRSFQVLAGYGQGSTHLGLLYVDSLGPLRVSGAIHNPFNFVSPGSSPIDPSLLIGAGLPF